MKRPFANLDNPGFPYGCSKLCNHPIDSEQNRDYRDILKKAKESWAHEGKTILLPEEELYIREQFNGKLAQSSSSTGKEHYHYTPIYIYSWPRYVNTRACVRILM